MKAPPFWPQATAELSVNDPVLGRIIGNYGGETLQGKADAFLTLVRSVTGQQISVKAADAIWARLENACGGSITVSHMKKLAEEDLRTLGYSRQKCVYLTDITKFFDTRKHLERDWAEMSDEEVIKDLIQIKGIGRWTAEMFLIFHLLRPDVFPVDDLGLLKAIRNTEHGIRRTEWKKSDYVALAETWRPWRSVATWYLWRSLDPVPVAY